LLQAFVAAQVSEALATPTIQRASKLVWSSVINPLMRRLVNEAERLVDAAMHFGRQRA
jgi:hypothetical protein